MSVPEHHSHPASDIPLEPALLTLLSPMPYQVRQYIAGQWALILGQIDLYLTQETVVADAVDMNVHLQAKFLDDIGRKRPDDAQYLADLEQIRREVPEDETESAKSEREAAERRVLLVTMDHGELIGHGDLLQCLQ